MDHKPGITGASESLNHYWTRGRGLARWAASPTPWTTLYHLLLVYIKSAHQAKGLANEYYHKVFGFYPDSDIARVVHGKKYRGDRIGRG